MTEYHKIQTVLKRDPATKMRTLLEGEYSLPELEYLADNAWDLTEKVDGTNIRVTVREDGRRFDGRTDAASIPAPLVAALEALFPEGPHLAEKLAVGAVLYGEGYGARIQKGGGNYRPDQSFVLFDVWVPASNPSFDGWWLGRENVRAVGEGLGLDVVPSLGVGTLRDAMEMARQGIRSRWGDFEAEGLVMRPTVELRTRAGHRIIAKVKTRDFR